VSLGQIASVTDAGRRRRHNEDSFVCEPPLFAVADGMGGAQAGEIASRLAATALRDPRPDEASGEPLVVSLIQEANRRVYERAHEDVAASGMGTTMTAALLEGDTVAIGHVGDSRAYRIRDSALEQLTEDHSLVAELVRSGKLSPEEAEVHPQRSVITRALGTEPDVDVDSFSITVRAGDVLMLCSDGLTSMVADRRILELVEKHRDDLERAGKALVDEANREGGEDNITVILFEVAASPTDTATTQVSRDEDDEDTLTEVDGVTVLAVDDPTVERIEPPPPRPKRRVARAAVALGILAVLALLGAAAVFALSRSHFVGAEHDGHVAVYQGVPWDLGGGVKLYRLIYESPLLAAQLSRPERRQLFDHDLQSKDSALGEVEAYERQVVP
jgi:protein phosphatase